MSKKQKWIGFKKHKFIGIDFDCKGNPLIEWQEALKLKISVIVDGFLVPQVGAIAMDQMVLDITDKPDIKIGKAVTILGSEGEMMISPQKWSDLSGSIPWEILCAFKNRLPRVVI